VIDLFAITHHPGPPLPDVAPLRAVSSHGLAAVCAPAGAVDVSPDALWRHEEVVEALMEDRDLLPVRYGTRLDDEAAAARALAQRHGDLARALERVRGAVELSLRVLVAGSQATPAGAARSGADYLRAKAGSAATVRNLDEPLAALARATRERPGRTPAELVRMSYLVERHAVERFVGVVARLQEASPGLRLLCTGPWPPYSFCEQ
jgi:Gas vesicle synthesis protein GvpL/GvpF